MKKELKNYQNFPFLCILSSYFLYTFNGKQHGADCCKSHYLMFKNKEKRHYVMNKVVLTIKDLTDFVFFFTDFLIFLLLYLGIEHIANYIQIHQRNRKSCCARSSDLQSCKNGFSNKGSFQGFPFWGLLSPCLYFVILSG